MRPDAAAAAVKSKPAFDFNQYMMQRAQIIDAALDKSVPMQYPEVINESMRYSLLAGAAAGACVAPTADVEGPLALLAAWRGRVLLRSGAPARCCLQEHVGSLWKISP